MSTRGGAPRRAAVTAPKRVLHCWMGKAEWAEKKYGNWTPEHLDALYVNPSTCMLERDHEGEHEFTPDGEIGVTFT